MKRLFFGLLIGLLACSGLAWADFSYFIEDNDQYFGFSEPQVHYNGHELWVTVKAYHDYRPGEGNYTAGLDAKFRGSIGRSGAGIVSVYHRDCYEPGQWASLGGLSYDDVTHEYSKNLGVLSADYCREIGFVVEKDPATVKQYARNHDIYLKWGWNTATLTVTEGGSVIDVVSPGYYTTKICANGGTDDFYDHYQASGTQDIFTYSGQDEGTLNWRLNGNYYYGCGGVTGSVSLDHYHDYGVWGNATYDSDQAVGNIEIEFYAPYLRYHYTGDGNAAGDRPRMLIYGTNMEYTNEDNDWAALPAWQEDDVLTKGFMVQRDNGGGGTFTTGWFWDTAATSTTNVAFGSSGADQLLYIGYTGSDVGDLRNGMTIYHIPLPLGISQSGSEQVYDSVIGGGSAWTLSGSDTAVREGFELVANDTDGTTGVSGSFDAPTTANDYVLMPVNVEMPYLGTVYVDANTDDAETYCEYSINATGDYPDDGDCTMINVSVTNTSNGRLVIGWLENTSVIGGGTTRNFEVSDTPIAGATTLTVNLTNELDGSDVYGDCTLYNSTDSDSQSNFTYTVFDTITGSLTITCSATGYADRTMRSSWNGSESVVIDVLMLESVEGTDFNVIAVDLSGQPISGVNVEAWKLIGSWTLVEYTTTDGSGLARLFLDYTRQHNISLYLEGYTSVSEFIVPSDQDRTFVMSSAIAGLDNDVFYGMSYSWAPDTPLQPSETVNATVQFNLQGTDFEYWGLNLSYNDAWSNSTFYTASGGGAANVSINLSGAEAWDTVVAYGYFKRENFSAVTLPETFYIVGFNSTNSTIYRALIDAGEEIPEYHKSILSIFITLFISAAVGGVIGSIGGDVAGVVGMATSLGAFTRVGYFPESSFALIAILTGAFIVSRWER